MQLYQVFGISFNLFLFSFTSRVYQGRGGDLEDFYVLVVILFCVSFHLLKNDIVIEAFIYALNWWLFWCHCVLSETRHSLDCMLDSRLFRRVIAVNVSTRPV